MLETWYIMEDGALGDPSKISTGEGGILRHEDGRAVSYGPHGPLSHGCVDADAERAKDMKPQESKRGYKTRESKAS